MRTKEDAMKAGRGKPGQTFVYIARRVSVAGESIDPDASVYPYASLEQAKAFCEEWTWKDLEGKGIDAEAMLATEWEDDGPISTLSMLGNGVEYGWGIDKMELRGQGDVYRPFEVQVEVWDTVSGLALATSKRYTTLGRTADEAMRRACGKIGDGSW